MVFARYSGFLHYLQLASHNSYAIEHKKVKKKKIPNSYGPDTPSENKENFKNFLNENFVFCHGEKHISRQIQFSNVS